MKLRLPFGYELTIKSARPTDASRWFRLYEENVSVVKAFGAFGKEVFAERVENLELGDAQRLSGGGEQEREEEGVALHQVVAADVTHLGDDSAPSLGLGDLGRAECRDLDGDESDSNAFEDQGVIHAAQHSDWPVYVGGQQVAE